jgi:hypothetical protein
MAQKLKLYIGCSLTHAPEEFKSSVEDLKTKLKTDFEVLEFIGLVNGTPTDVYHHDVQTCVGTCDLFVAICDFPSLGLGYELGTAVEKLHKPVLAVAQKDAHITRLVIGIDAPGFEFKRYTVLSEVYDLISNRAKELKSR